MNLTWWKTESFENGIWMEFEAALALAFEYSGCWYWATNHDRAGMNWVAPYLVPRTSIGTPWWVGCFAIRSRRSGIREERGFWTWRGMFRDVSRWRWMYFSCCMIHSFWLSQHVICGNSSLKFVKSVYSVLKLFGVPRAQWICSNDQSCEVWGYWNGCRYREKWRCHSSDGMCEGCRSFEQAFWMYELGIWLNRWNWEVHKPHRLVRHWNSHREDECQQPMPTEILKFDRVPCQ